jgi:hypothetical protein
MSAGLVELGDDVRYRIADAGDLGEPVFGDKYIEWDGKSCQAVSGPGIGFCPVGVAATQCRALRVFSQEACYTAGIERRHSTSLPSRVLKPRRTRTISSARAFPGRTVERPLKLLGCPEVLKVLCIRAVSGFFLEEIKHPPARQLQMPHPAVRNGPSLTRSADSISPEVIESV